MDARLGQKDPDTNVRGTLFARKLMRARSSLLKWGSCCAMGRRSVMDSTPPCHLELQLNAHLSPSGITQGWMENISRKSHCPLASVCDSAQRGNRTEPHFGVVIGDTEKCQFKSWSWNFVLAGGCHSLLFANHAIIQPSQGGAMPIHLFELPKCWTKECENSQPFQWH